MSPKAPPRWITLALLAIAVILPIVICVVWGVSELLGAMDDFAGRTALRYIALGLGVLWGVALICLVLVQALGSLGDGGGRE